MHKLTDVRAVSKQHTHAGTHTHAREGLVEDILASGTWIRSHDRGGITASACLFAGVGEEMKTGGLHG